METRSRKEVRKGGMVFVTVGTTQFDNLIKSMCTESVLQLLTRLGYNLLVLQIGAGKYEPDIADTADVKTLHYRFKPSIKEDIEDADLVISHAGAGSCLETLGAGKKLLVVINEELMGNHQLELAYKLSKDGHIHYTTCSGLEKTLKTKDFSQLVPFERGKPEVFAEFLDNVMGFS